MKRRNIWVGAAVGVLAIGAWAVTMRANTPTTSYRFVEVTRSAVESTVTATGNVQATETVEVGTQVSGQIAELYVDFNDRVEEGQLLARIDPTILEQEVRSAQVNLARNQADLDQATRALERAEELYASQVLSQTEYEAAQYQHALAEADHEAAEIGLERAERNLQYSEIRAPIAGVVIARAVEVGQTVAASLSAPVLFVLAHDLAQMEILASVDESDIGQIEEGQPVHFSVQAYPDRTFEGVVRQVRLEASTQENVVTYSVVVAVENEDGSLLPGMTATLDIVLERAEDVLAVPNTALRFRATTEMQEAVVRSADTPRDRPATAQSGSDRGAAAEPERAEGSTASTLWYIGDDGRLRVARVRTGLSDGAQTVVLDPPDDVRAGLQVIAAVTTSSTEAAAENPFQSQQQTAGPGGRRPGGF